MQSILHCFPYLSDSLELTTSPISYFLHLQSFSMCHLENEKEQKEMKKNNYKLIKSSIPKNLKNNKFPKISLGLYILVSDLLKYVLWHIPAMFYFMHTMHNEL